MSLDVSFAQENVSFQKLYRISSIITQIWVFLQVVLLGLSTIFLCQEHVFQYHSRQQMEKHEGVKAK